MKWQEIPTPCYVVDEKKLKQNLKILQNLEKETGCHVLLAQKAFSMFSLYPLSGQYISGTTASGIFEARLGKEEMGKENHVFAPAYKEKDMEELANSVEFEVYKFNEAAASKTTFLSLAGICSGFKSDDGVDVTMVVC